MDIKKIPGDFTVCKVIDYSQVNLDDEFVFIGKTDEEHSLVCRTDCTPSNTIEREDAWKAFRIEGTLDFSLVGILAKISNIMTDNSISIFAVSTFNTDYIFIKEENFDQACMILSENDYQII